MTLSDILFIDIHLLGRKEHLQHYIAYMTIEFGKSSHEHVL